MRMMIDLLGPLRLALLGLIGLSALSAAFAGGEVSFEFPEILSTLIAPPVAVMLAFVVPLDVLMSLLFMSDKTDAERARFVRIVIVELGALAILVAAWAPFFSELLVR